MLDNWLMKFALIVSTNESVYWWVIKDAMQLKKVWHEESFAGSEVNIDWEIYCTISGLLSKKL